MSTSAITKHALAHAIKELMCRTPFDKISVGEICAACGLSRKSFYYHFKDKYDLIAWIFQTEFVATVPPDGYANAWQFLEELCTYFYQERDFYREAMRIEGQNSFRACFDQLMRPLIDQFLRRIFAPHAPSVFAQTFLSDALLTSLMRWLSDGTRLTPEAYLAELRQLLLHIARDMLTG